MKDIIKRGKGITNQLDITDSFLSPVALETTDEIKKRFAQKWCKPLPCR